MQNTPVGHRVRSQRQQLGLTQSGLAKRVGISPSYLNLIEHNRRAIGGSLLRRLAQALDIDVQSLSGAEEARLAADLEEILADPVLAATPVPRELTERLAGTPEVARAMLALYRAYLDARNQVETLCERVSTDPFLGQMNHRILTLITSIRSVSEILRDYGDLDVSQRLRFNSVLVEESRALTRLTAEMFDFIDGRGARNPAPSPTEQVDDVIYDHDSHFPALETAADAVRATLGAEVSPSHAALLEHLRRRHGITVSSRAAGSMAPRGAHYDPAERTLLLSESLSAASARFELARLIGDLDARQQMDAAVTDPRLTTEEARRRCRRALCGYFAGALLFPYAEFLETARSTRYDVERLQQRFQASFEQVCHRLCTLRRSGEEGIPFHFLRVDIAGNISKRFSASGLRLPHYGGACPRWAVYAAFLTPERIVRQVAQLPDGSTYLFVARTLSRPGTGFGSPRSHHAVMIGCDIAYARSLVYADGLELRGDLEPTPVGVSCRHCPREDCDQRAFERLADATL
jgi:predicted transcriptional regulator/transcriptional regulator with XRE-family HTH domain